jgi:hypothetical protein
MTRWLEQLDLFCGEITPQRAVVYARCPLPETAGKWKLAGRLRGPMSKFGGTLPANSALQDLGPGKTLLAKALVPDPCRWTPSHPSHYLADVELFHNGELVERIRRTFAIRQLVVQSGGLFLASERTILRAARSASVLSHDIAAWHEVPLVRVINQWDDAMLNQALLEGCLLVADCTHIAADQLQDTIRRLSSHSAVGIAILHSSFADWDTLRKIAPNLLFAASLTGTVGISAPALIWSAADPSAEAAQRLSTYPMPIIVERRLSKDEHAASPSDARLACDQLQADWAPFGQFAGYVV